MVTAPSASDRVVIVGAGLAGANVAVTLREEGYRGRIALLGDEAMPPFGRPPRCRRRIFGAAQVLVAGR